MECLGLDTPPPAPHRRSENHGCFAAFGRRGRTMHCSLADLVAHELHDLLAGGSSLLIFEDVLQ